MSDEILIPNYQQEMLNTIDAVDQYTWNRDKLGGFSFGDAQMDMAFNGMNSCVYIIAGSPNIGKSALSLQLSWQAAHANENLYPIYYSLDDMATQTIPRIIANDQHLGIDVISTPKKYETNDALMRRRSAGFQKLKDSVDRYKVIDRTSVQTIEQLKTSTIQHKAMVEGETGKKIAIFVDALNNLEIDAKISEKQEKLKYISRTLKEITELHDIPVIATTHLKKLNGHRRPIADDIKETNDIQYDAYGIILCYSEIGIKGQVARVFHEEPNRLDHLPVLEGHVVKNKCGEFKDRLFWNFYPGNSSLVIPPEERIKYYNSQIS